MTRQGILISRQHTFWDHSEAGRHSPPYLQQCAEGSWTCVNPKSLLFERPLCYSSGRLGSLLQPPITRCCFSAMCDIKHTYLHHPGPPLTRHSFQNVGHRCDLVCMCLAIGVGFFSIYALYCMTYHLPYLPLTLPQRHCVPSLSSMKGRHFDQMPRIVLE